MPIYTNAESVLPPDLLREVKKHWNGLLYIPSDRMTATPNEDVLLAIQSGCPAQEVALAHDIPVWQVYRIAPDVALTRNDGRSDGTIRQSPPKRPEAPKTGECPEGVENEAASLEIGRRASTVPPCGYI